MADEKAKFLNGYGLATLWSKIKAYAVEKNSNTVIVGNQAYCGSTNGISLGYNAVTSSSGTDSIAIGYFAKTCSAADIAIGKNSIAMRLRSIAIGLNAVAGQNDSIAIGTMSNGNRINSIAIGQNAKADSINSIAIGTNSLAMTSETESSIAIGPNAKSGLEGSIVIGCNANGYNSTSSYAHRTIAIGVNAKCGYAGGIALGANTYIGSNLSIAIGTDAYSHTSSIAIGYKATTNTGSTSAISIGYTADIGKSSAHAIAIGYNASIKANSLNCIAIGQNCWIYNSTATKDAPNDNSICIASEYTLASNNTIRLGNDSISRFNVKVGISTTSDERDKADIQNIGYGATAFLKKVRAIRYVFNARTLYLPDGEHRTEEDKENFSKYGICEYDREAHARGDKKGERIRVGVIAQEVLQALKDVYDDESYGNIVDDNFHDMDKSQIPENIENQYTITYANFVPFLIKAIQEIDERLTSLERM